METKTGKHFIKENIIDILQARDYGDIKGPEHLKNDLHLDSLDMVELGMSLEQTFQINLSDEEIFKIGSMTVDEVVDKIESVLTK